MVCILTEQRSLKTLFSYRLNFIFSIHLFIGVFVFGLFLDYRLLASAVAFLLNKCKFVCLFIS